MANNGPANELDDGSVRACHVCIDQSYQMPACGVSIAIQYTTKTTISQKRLSILLLFFSDY